MDEGRVEDRVERRPGIRCDEGCVDDLGAGESYRLNIMALGARP